LDSEAEFQIHRLDSIVENTNVLVCILSVGYLESPWCVTELKAAIRSGKKIIVVREYMYTLPEVFSEEVKEVEEVLRKAPTIAWMAGLTAWYNLLTCRI
jgi:hypothetical protein